MGIVVVIVVLVALLCLLSVVWLISPERRACHAAAEKVESLIDEIRLCVGFPRGTMLSQERAARSYVEARRAGMRGAISIEELKSRGVKNVRWASLASAGIRTLADLHGASVASLTSLPGVGDASAERVLDGAKAAARDIEKASVPMPGTFLSSDTAVALVARVARAQEAAQLSALGLHALPDLTREANRRLVHLRTQATVWRWAFGAQARGQDGSVLHAAALVEDAVYEARSTPAFSSVRQRIDQIDGDWPLNDARRLTSAVRDSYAELQDPITAVLRSVARSIVDWRTDMGFAPPGTS